jgi:ubiquinone/menaquinone biosynthesis C-methylase UbiE
MRYNLGSGANKLEGFKNLDKLEGWSFEDGIGEAEAITISHALMYVKDLPKVLKGLYEALEDGGVLRITEDDTNHWKWPDRNIDTSPMQMQRELKKAGFKTKLCKPRETKYKDKSLIQEFHGKPPKVFHIEAWKK